MGTRRRMGHLYQRGTVWWVKYYINGCPHRESTGTEKLTEAERVLHDRLGRKASGQPLPPRLDRIRYPEIAEDLRRYYRTTGSRDLKEAEVRLKNLDRFFGQCRVVDITPSLATQYVEQRQRQGRTNGAINRELATLIKMLNIAYENNKLLRPPRIRKLKEASPREGFFELEQFKAVRKRLDPDLQVVVSIAHELGWRIQSEVLTLGLAQVNLKEGTLRLEPGTTKNDSGRIVYMSAELKVMVAAQVERVQELQRRLGQITPHLFPHLKGKLIGTRRKDFRKAWEVACRKAGCPGMRKHDLRRTAVRNLVNDGIPENTAMKITGHKTRAVFDRYHIVSPEDLRAAACKRTGTI